MRFRAWTAWTTTLILLGAGAGAPAVPVAQAGAPSITPGMPPEIVSWREVILPRETYGELAGQWREYLEEHPESAVARVELSRALRYAGAPIEERSALVREAYELDPTCPEALDAMAGTFLGGEHLVEGPREAYALGQQAVALAPQWPDPHFNLWSIAMVLGDEEEARGQLRAILETEGIAAPVLDFGYNLLVSAEPGGVVFTNGDNDTYPPLALQVARDVHPDVLIVNLSLLNRIEYAESVWKGLPRGERPFSASEIRRMYEGWKKDKEEGERFSGVVVDALARQVAKGSWKHPVYFAVTVYPGALESYEGHLRLEGLLWRLTREPVAGGSEEDPAMDTLRTLALFQEDFRLDSATDLAYTWQPGNAAARLMQNYVAILRLVATNEAEGGDLEDARYALREALTIAAFHGDTDTVGKLVAYWKELEPDNPEVDRWQ